MVTLALTQLQSIATFVVIGYYLLSTIKFPQFYNRIAVLVLECFMVVWWLACWANLAAWAAAYTAIDTSFASSGTVTTGSGGTYCYNGVCVKSKRELAKRSLNWRAYRGALAAAAGIGALNL
jgi:hypothetical protein